MPPFSIYAGYPTPAARLFGQEGLLSPLLASASHLDDVLTSPIPITR